MQRFGFDLVRSLPPDDILRRRIDLLRQHRVDVVFDIGANAGQYVATLRALGYQGRVVSFEPSSEAFRLLSQAARRDPGWVAVNCALGEREGSTTLHLSGNSQSSSVLAMLPAHLAAAPSSAYVAEETVAMTTLARQIDRYLQPGERLFVKIDTQGSEGRVLSGAADRLSFVVGLQLELSMVPLYEKQPLVEELIATVRALGFVPMLLEPDFYDPTAGQLLQADGIFFRVAPVQPANTKTPADREVGATTPSAIVRQRATHGRRRLRNLRAGMPDSPRNQSKGDL